MDNTNKNVTKYEKQWIYRLTFSPIDKEPVVITYPFSLSFNITTNTYASANTAHFTIKNLSLSTRNYFYKDRINPARYIGVTFEIGYEDDLILIFKGYVLEAYSVRSGTDIDTSVEAMGLGLNDILIAETFKAGTTFKEAYKQIVSAAGLKIGALGTLEGVFKQETTIYGKPLEALNKITGGHTFIDGDTVNTLQDNEGIGEAVTIINSDTGLLGTPMRRDSQVICDIMLSPQLRLGQLLEIQSKIQTEFNGTFVVIGLSHQGVISPTENGNRTTTLNLLDAYGLKNSNVNLTNQTQKQPPSKVVGETVTPITGAYGSEIKEVLEYIRTHDGDIPNKAINPRISWKEMLGNDNTAQERLQELDERILYNCKNTADNFYSFLLVHFPGQTITVVSGWRSKANNSSTKTEGVANSRHLTGQAIDFKFNKIANYHAFWSVFARNWIAFTELNKWGNIHIQVTGNNIYKNKKL